MFAFNIADWATSENCGNLMNYSWRKESQSFLLHTHTHTNVHTVCLLFGLFVDLMNVYIAYIGYRFTESL